MTNDARWCSAGWPVDATQSEDRKHKFLTSILLRLSYDRLATRISVTGFIYEVCACLDCHLELGSTSRGGGGERNRIRDENK